jgi:hypothetical protein
MKKTQRRLSMKKQLKKRQNKSLYHKMIRTTPIEILIRNQKIVVDPTNKDKTKEQKVGNKDQTTSMDGKWVETKMRKRIYGVVALRVKHPILVKR